jgi:hypothetical protein
VIARLTSLKEEVAITVEDVDGPFVILASKTKKEFLKTIHKNMKSVISAISE